MINKLTFWSLITKAGFQFFSVHYVLRQKQHALFFGFYFNHKFVLIQLWYFNLNEFKSMNRLVGNELTDEQKKYC